MMESQDFILPDAHFIIAQGLCAQDNRRRRKSDAAVPSSLQTGGKGLLSPESSESSSRVFERRRNTVGPIELCSAEKSGNTRALRNVHRVSVGATPPQQFAIYPPPSSTLSSSVSSLNASQAPGRQYVKQVKQQLPVMLLPTPPQSPIYIKQNMLVTIPEASSVSESEDNEDASVYQCLVIGRKKIRFARPRLVQF